jgi:hypothetical protein
MNTLIQLYAGFKETIEKQSMGFRMSSWDEKLLKYGSRFESDLMDLRVLTLEHLAPVAVGAIRNQPEPLAVGTPRLRPMVERPGHEREGAVDSRAEPVSGADLAAFAAADHAPVQSCHLTDPLT